MPIYSFENIETGEVHDKIMSWDEKVKYLEENPNVKSIITGAPSLVKGTGDRTKPPAGFKDVLSRVAQSNPTSALAETWGKKDATSVKIRDAVKKVKKKIGNISTDS